MLFGRYRFFSVLEDDAILPEYKGSTFRGLFGTALRNVVCALRRNDCTDCLLSEKCVYAFVFETREVSDQGNEKKRIAAPPHPYVIEPPEGNQSHFRAGDSFDFTLLLFGSTNDYLPYFIYAFEQMGKLGIGKRINGNRPGFVLKTVTREDQPIYAAEDRKIRKSQSGRDLQVAEVGVSASQGISQVELVLKTPLRLKFQNQLEAALPFHVLTRAMLRRISSLEKYYGLGEPLLDYRGLVQRAEAVQTSRSSLRWFDWKRYSNRQEQSMLMGGLVGRVTYEGDLTEFVPLLRFCEQVHLGKQTAFGLGRFEFMTDTE